MGNYVMKIEFKDSDKLTSFLERAYYKDGTMGKLSSNEHLIDFQLDEDNNFLLKLNKEFIKIWNDDIIDGVLQCIVNVDGDNVSLKPFNFYSIKEGGKYVFY